MKTFDLEKFSVCDLDEIDLQNIDGGFWQLVIAFVASAIAGGLIYDGVKAVAIESYEALNERASYDGYVVWADVSHR